MNETYELNNDNFKGYEIILHEDNFASENEFGLYFIKLTIFFNNGNKLKYSIRSSSNPCVEIQSLFDRIKKDKNYKITINGKKIKNRLSR